MSIDPTGSYHGDSDLQLERINVYYNEAAGEYEDGTLLSTLCQRKGLGKYGFKEMLSALKMPTTNKTLCSC
jgi:hypothetical protein